MDQLPAQGTKTLFRVLIAVIEIRISVQAQIPVISSVVCDDPFNKAEQNTVINICPFKPLTQSLQILADAFQLCRIYCGLVLYQLLLLIPTVLSLVKDFSSPEALHSWL
jgi:hypothetical protein